MDAWTRILLHLSLLFYFLQFTSSIELKFAQWGKTCKLSDVNKDDLPEPRYECDSSKGFICEKYQQGNLCGCKLGGPLSYDPVSGECRRKVGAMCHRVETPEEYKATPFNRKCHINAECLRYSEILLGNNKQAESDKQGKYYCYCKEGFKATPDSSRCADPNGASTINFHQSVPTLLIGIWVIRAFLA